MIKCTKCEFEVSGHLKYSIMNNLCPACGYALFSDTDMMRIKELSRTIREEEFSQDMDNVKINDISLFIFNTFIKINEAKKSLDSDVEFSEEAVSADDSNDKADNLDDLREEVRLEATQELSDIPDEDEDFKIARLKRLARDSNLTNKSSVVVKRVK